MATMVNISNISPHAYTKLCQLDENFIGTDNYLGIAFFWNYKYRHYMRDLTPAKRVKIHKKLVALCLRPDGDSPEHDAIMLK